MFSNPEAEGSQASRRKSRGKGRHPIHSNPHAAIRHAQPNLILRARIVVPVSGRPIEDGAVAIAGERIVAVGKWREISSSHRAEVTDLGEMILLPGLVNAHCHLDYTCMAGQIRPTKSFVDWIKLITTSKGGLIFSDFADSWLSGARMLLRTGTTTVADVEMVPELLPDIWTATPLRVISFLEMTGVKSRRPAPEILGEAMEKIASIQGGRNRMGLSPHAPYSTLPELLRLAGETARRKNLPLTTHVAESNQEFEMFVEGRGAMFDWLRRSGRDMSDCGLGSPVQHLERAGLLCKNLLAIHVNHLAPGDAELLAKRGVSVVHCPRSHSYFKHRAFPFDELRKAGVNICLGTDSMASLLKARKQLPELNMFDEMRQFAETNPALNPEKILEMATVNGACALGFKNQFGQLGRGAFADVIAIPHSGKINTANEAILGFRGPVAASMINGEWAVSPANAVAA
jgi:cytosine/adenosine deaminase-related metal-dependent hydrolase